MESFGISKTFKEKAIFIFVKNVLPPIAALMSSIYQVLRNRFWKVPMLFAMEIHCFYLSLSLSIYLVLVECISTLICLYAFVSRALSSRLKLSLFYDFHNLTPPPISHPVTQFCLANTSGCQSSMPLSYRFALTDSIASLEHSSRITRTMTDFCTSLTAARIRLVTSTISKKPRWILTMPMTASQMSEPATIDHSPWINFRWRNSRTGFATSQVRKS